MLKNRKVTFVTLDILPQVAPLAGGYLQAYACADPEIGGAWQFEQYVNMPRSLTPARLADALAGSEAGVYAFSCYAWNMGLFKSVIPMLFDARPDAHVILGGPQVMNYAHKYLDPARENLVLCNGEGEKTFRGYLKELGGGAADFSGVRGLSFYRGGELVTTQAEERIKDLDEIPSPILQGLFDPSVYHHVFIETNRGCPFTCFYCYWGGAIGAKVNRFSEERIRAELEWVARHGIYSLAIVDANWGILQRDVELSRFIVECKERHGAPRVVGFSGSKNTPERVTEITKIFNDGGLLLNHTISLQTMQEETLRKVGRQNIKTEAYMSMQEYMNANGIGSHVELIWPLPGESLATFKSGVDQLCAAAADMFFCHPLYMINNVELNNRREAYGIVSEETEDAGSEAEIVVQTKEVSYDDYVEGWRFMFSTLILHNLRSAYCLAKHLHAAGRESFSGLYTSFAHFLRDNPDLPLAELVEAGVAARSVEATTLGRIGYYMFSSRDEFDALLARFVSSQPWWDDEAARVCFEVDLLNRPHLYAPEIKGPPAQLRHVEILETTGGWYTVALPGRFLPTLKSLLGAKASFHANPVIIDHRQNQIARDPSSVAELHWVFCYQGAFSVVQISPTWRN